MDRIPSLALCITLVWTLSAVVPAQAQPGTVLSHQKISDTQGGFTGILDDLDHFGASLASLGDLDGDGVGDLAVAGGPLAGRSWFSVGYFLVISAFACLDRALCAVAI